MISENIPILGIGEAETTVSKAKISSIHSIFNYSLPILLIQNITNRLAPIYMDSKSLTFPKGIKLANPKFDISTKIDILLGIEVFWKLLAVEQPYLDSLPLIYNTHLGYIVSGQHAHTLSSICGISTLELSRQIQQFWEIEHIIVSSKLLSAEEHQCETIFTKTVSRDHNGHFIVTIHTIELKSKRFGWIKTKCNK